MSAQTFRQTVSRSASGTRSTQARNRPDSAQLGNLAILASTTTGEVAVLPPLPAGVRASGTLSLCTRSTPNA